MGILIYVKSLCYMVLGFVGAPYFIIIIPVKFLFLVFNKLILKIVLCFLLGNFPASE